MFGKGMQGSGCSFLEDEGNVACCRLQNKLHMTCFRLCGYDVYHVGYYTPLSRLDCYGYLLSGLVNKCLIRETRAANEDHRHRCACFLSNGLFR